MDRENPFLKPRQLEVLRHRLDGEMEAPKGHDDYRVWSYLRERLPAVVKDFVEAAARQAETFGRWEERSRRHEAEGDPRSVEEYVDAVKRVATPPAPGEPLVERLIVWLMEGLPRARRRTLLVHLTWRQDWPDPPRRVTPSVGRPSDLADVGRAVGRGHGGRWLAWWALLDAVEAKPRKTDLLRRAPSGSRSAVGEALDRLRADGLVEFYEESEGPGRPPIRVRLTEKGRWLRDRWRALEVAD